MIHLTPPQDWFFKGHVITGGYRDLRGMWIPHHAPNKRCYLWALPPVIANVALEEAMKAIRKRTDATHVFIIPRLCGIGIFLMHIQDNAEGNVWYDQSTLEYVLNHGVRGVHALIPF
jgi:hypothetical protein